MNRSNSKPQKPQGKNRGSKYAKKSKGAPQEPRPNAEPVFLYLCDCHGQRATKKPCQREFSGGKPVDNTLGSWRCSLTNRPTKVSRRENHQTETDVAA